MEQELGIVTPVYSTKRNSRLNYFKDTTGSILAQNLDFLCVVVDDGSTDETPDYVQSIHDNRVSYVRLERTSRSRLTSSVAANAGLNYLMDKGCSYLAYVHSDDLITQCSLERRVNALKQGAEMAYGRLTVYQHEQLTLNEFNRPGQCSIPMGMGFPHHTSMWSRKMMELMMRGREHNLFDTNIDCAEDLDVTLYSRKVMEEHKFHSQFVDAVLYIWVKSNRNITELVKDRTMRKQVKWIFEKNGFDVPESIRESLLKKLVTRPGYWLPERIKKQLRPIKEEITRLTRDRLYPRVEEGIILTDIDPFWFRN
ncbi:glycosyltransferase family 2 protein [Candidatus Woesearchaeota archaeon]|nr:glycosyltransferase family 2 protein [Candidatus Woesearchaeota archaeon]